MRFIVFYTLLYANFIVFIINSQKLKAYQALHEAMLLQE